MMRTKASPSRYRNQEILEELFDEINDYLGDRKTPPVEQYPPSAPSNKTAVESVIEPPTPSTNVNSDQQQPILVESEDSEEEDGDYDNDHHAYHTQQQQQSLDHCNPRQQKNHHRRQSITITSQQEQQCLLLCSATEESPSVCMCYNCKKKKSEEVYRAVPTKNPSPRSKQQPRRSWTSAASNGFGLGGMIADRVKQTFAYSNNNSTKPMSPSTTIKQQQYENYSGYEEPKKRPSSRGENGRKRWIPRPKSLPAISAYVQKRQVHDDSDTDNNDDENIYEEEEKSLKHRRPSWSSKKSNRNSRRSSRRSSIYTNNNDNYNEDNNYYVNNVNDTNDYDEKTTSAVLSAEISEKYEMGARQQKVDYYYQEVQQHQQQEREPQQHQMYDSNIYGNEGRAYQQYQGSAPLSTLSSVTLPPQQCQSFQQQQQPAEQYSIMDQSLQYDPEQQQKPQQFLTEPLQASPTTTTPSSLPALTELPFLTPATRVGEEHYPLKMKDSRTLPTKQERMNAYNNAYYHCIMSKTNLIPWLTKQYSKGPPDAMFEYTPKPKKTSKKLFSIFKLCNTGNKDGRSNANNSASSSTSNNSQIPWQPSVSPGYLISPPVSASPNSASILTNNSSIQIQPQHQQQLQQTVTAFGWPINNNSTNSSLLSPAPPLVGNTSEISMSPSSNATSTFTPISAADDGASYHQHNDYYKTANGGQQQLKEDEEEDDEPFEPVLPRPRSFCSSNISFNSNNLENRPSRSSGISFASTSKSDIQPVSILKKSRSSASLQPQPNKFYSDNDNDDYDNNYDEDLEEDGYYEGRSRINSKSRKFLETPKQQQRRQPRRGHVKRRSFSQVEEPIYYMDRRRRNSYQHSREQPRRSSSRSSFRDPEQEEIYGDDLVTDDDDDVPKEAEYHLVQDIDDRPLPRRILGRARPHSGFYHSGRLNHLRSSRGPPPLWVAAEDEPEYIDDVDDDLFPPPMPRRQRRISSGRRPSRPSSRNSIVVYDDMMPIPAPRASPVYYY